MYGTGSVARSKLAVALTALRLRQQLHVHCVVDNWRPFSRCKVTAAQCTVVQVGVDLDPCS